MNEQTELKRIADALERLGSPDEEFDYSIHELMDKMCADLMRIADHLESIDCNLGNYLKSQSSVSTDTI
jgi:hypothetical protein